MLVLPPQRISDNVAVRVILAVCLAAMFTILRAKSGRLSCAVKRVIKKGAVIGRPLSLLICRGLECAVDAFASFDQSFDRVDGFVEHGLFVFGHFDVHDTFDATGTDDCGHTNVKAF